MTTTETLIEFRWTMSRGRDTYGYNICSLWVDGRRVSACNGGGYDMKGTALGNFIASRYADRLCALPVESFPEQRGGGERRLYGLTFHDPNYDPGQAVIGECADDRTLGGSKGETVAEAEAAGKSLGLERYQAIYRASSPVPTDRHTVPSIDGACGMSCVETIMRAIGLSLRWVPGRRNRKNDVYILVDERE